MKKVLIRFTEEKEKFIGYEYRTVITDKKYYELFNFPASWGGFFPSRIIDGYVLAKCIHCGKLQLLSFADVSSESFFERQMGYEIQYIGSISAICKKCGIEELFADIEFWEYPISDCYIEDISLNDFETDLCCTDYIQLLFDNIELLDNNARVSVKYEIIEAQELKKKSDELNKEIKRLESLVSNLETKESDFQDFFETNFWMFGVDYKNAIPQEKISDEDIPDFLLEKHNGYHDILDLKLPIQNLFKKKGNKLHPRHELTEGVSQIDIYIDRSTAAMKKIESEKGVKIYRPQGILVIGRSDDSEKKRLQQFKDDHPKVKILTYDEIIQRGSHMIKIISCYNFKS